MSEKKKERFYYERSKDGELTGITVCTSEEGIKGYAFCHPGKYIIESDDIYTTILTEIKPDQFRKISGREIARGRMKKMKKLLNDPKYTNVTAYNQIYSGRMKKRIKQFQERELARIDIEIEDSE